MIRRGFWLAAGAMLGVAGYRRATRLGRWLTSPGDDPRNPRRAGGTWATPSPAGLGGQPAGSVGTPGTPGAALAAPPSHRAATRRASTVARVLAAVSFVRDVRQGMAEYSDLHSELARTLGSRSDRISSG